MKIKLLCCLMVFLLVLPVAAKPPKGDYIAPSTAIIDNSTFIDVNRILMFVTNHGNFGRDLAGVFGYDYGTWWPYAGDTSAISGNVGRAGDYSPNYAAGLWVGARVDNRTRVIVSEYSSEYVPGPMVGGTYVEDSPEFRVYKLYRDSLAGNPNSDYLNWPVDQGAPVDENGDPDMIGDQMLWCVYNDADPGGHGNEAGETAPLGLEVRQTVFGFDRLGSLGDMVFARYRIYNEGGNTLEDCYFSIWFDPDLGDAGDDFVGCDTLTDLGFVYNDGNFDNQYGTGPPAMGCDFFQGPLRAITDADTADDGTPLIGRMWGQEFPDSVNLGLSSFNKYINGTDPDNFDEVYGFMRGLTKAGTAYVYNGDTLTFVQTGDPVTGEGDLDIASADRRWMQTTGPVTFAPGDSTEILIAVIMGQGSNNLTSVTVVKNLDVFAQKLYEEGFNPPAAPAKPNVTVAALSQEITLSWDDTSEVDPGEFPFEGYSLWQGETPSGPWQLLSTWDVVNDREDATNALIDTVFDTESGRLLPTIMRSVKNTGLAYHYRTTMDALTNTRLKDVSEYYFRVSAFSFGYFKQNGDAVPNGDRFLESARDLIVIPGAPLPGVNPQVGSGVILPVTHATGISDGVIEPFVLDPKALTGHEYRVTFEINTIEVTDIEEDTSIVVGIDTCFYEQFPIFDPDSLPEQEIVIDYFWGPVLCADTTVTETFVTSEMEITVWNLDDLSTNPPTRLIDGYTNQGNNNAYPVLDGLLLRVTGPATPGLKTCDMFDCPNDPSTWGWDIPAGERRFTWAEGDWGFEAFRGALGWDSPAHTFNGLPRLTAAEELKGVLLQLATVDEEGNFDPADENVSYAYRYLRLSGNPPAQPEFAPFITPGTGYAFQEFERTMPLSAWNTDTDPPTRLALGYLENNAALAVLDGKYFPQESDVLVAQETDNVDGGGPREWLFIFDAEYSETVNPTYATDVLNDGAIPVMYWATWNRRGSDVPFSPGASGEDQFLIVPAKVNLPADTFYFTAPAPQLTSTEVDLDAIKAVPNPFYLLGGYDPNPGSYAIKFHHLPEECTISIYNLGGDLVRVIDKDDATTSIATWDVLTENGLPVASGIYIYVVDAPGFGTKIGKMAVFVQQEVLNIY